MRSLKLVCGEGMPPIVDFPPKNIDKTYYIMEVCNLCNEIIIKVFIYFYDLSS